MIDFASLANFTTTEALARWGITCTSVAVEIYVLFAIASFPPLIALALLNLIEAGIEAREKDNKKKPHTRPHASLIKLVVYYPTHKRAASGASRPSFDKRKPRRRPSSAAHVGGPGEYFPRAFS